MFSGCCLSLNKLPESPHFNRRKFSLYVPPWSTSFLFSTNTSRSSASKPIPSTPQTPKRSQMIFTNKASKGFQPIFDINTPLENHLLAWAPSRMSTGRPIAPMYCFTSWEFWATLRSKRATRFSTQVL